jgi:hypothetical protein
MTNGEKMVWATWYVRALMELKEAPGLGLPFKEQIRSACREADAAVKALREHGNGEFFSEITT